jgi:hypothetical protein
MTPAPGAYKSETVKPLKEARAPAYSMGARTDLRKTDVTPAPTSYALGTTVGSKTATLNTSPAHSMAARTKKGKNANISDVSYSVGGFADDLQKTPGPGRYNVTADPIKTKQPSYSLQGRTYVPAGTADSLDHLAHTCRQHKEARTWRTQP